MTYVEVQSEIKLKFCMYKTAYTVSALKKSNVYDDVDFLTDDSRLLKSIYTLNKGVCRNNWQNKIFAKPGFGNRTFKVNTSLTETFLRQASETTSVAEHSQSFMAKKNGREGVMYAEPVDWVSPTGEKNIGNVVLNSKITSEQFGASCFK